MTSRPMSGSPPIVVRPTSIAANIPLGPVNVIREDPHLKDVLYLGTDVGVYVSVNGGEQWHALPGDLPSTFVHDLAIHERDKIMVAATHGHGMWALDLEAVYAFAFFAGGGEGEE